MIEMIEMIEMKLPLNKSYSATVYLAVSGTNNELEIFVDFVEQFSEITDQLQKDNNALCCIIITAILSLQHFLV